MVKKKMAISVTIDHDLYDWMRADGEKMSRIVNSALRAYVLAAVAMDVASTPSPCTEELPDGSIMVCGYCSHCLRVAACE
jgi:hypothetical protein